MFLYFAAMMCISCQHHQSLSAADSEIASQKAVADLEGGRAGSAPPPPMGDAANHGHVS